MATVQTPAVARNVHYVARGDQTGTHRAAIITAVYPVQYDPDPDAPLVRPGTVDLTVVDLAVFQVGWTEFVSQAPYDPLGRMGSWHWPEHVLPTEIPDPA